MMKKFRHLVWVFSALSLLLFSSVAFAATEITVFAAASMTESMNQIAELYKAVAPDVKVVYNFDSSGTLRTQIQQGAECDVFLSAGQSQMNDIEEQFVLPGTRFNIVSNQVVLIVPKDANKNVNPKGINDFRDVVTDKVFLVALGNADVPVGQYAEQIYKNLGLWEELQSMKKTTFGSNVKEVLSQVAAGAVDCGIVYGTDAATNNDVEVVANAPEGSHEPITYPAAILKDPKDEAATRAFVEFLKGREASNIFTSIGFAIPAK